MDWKYPFSLDELLKAKTRKSEDVRVQFIEIWRGEIFLRSKVRSTPPHIFDIANRYLKENYKPVDPFSFLELVEKDIGKTSKSYEFQFEQFIQSGLGVLGFVNVYPINDQFVEISIGTNWGYLMLDQEGSEPNIKYERVREFIASFADYFELKFSSKRETEITFKLANKDQKPNSRTQLRFEVFRKLKEQHLTWSQARVAMEAFNELGEVVTADTVRNAYRSMKVKWPSGRIESGKKKSTGRFTLTALKNRYPVHTKDTDFSFHRDPISEQSEDVNFKALRFYKVTLVGLTRILAEPMSFVIGQFILRNKEELCFSIFSTQK